MSEKPPSDKPVISEIEANWNIHLAGLRSEKEARAKGIPEGSGETLLDAAIGGRVIGGVLFPPIHAAFMLMMAKLEDLPEARLLRTEMDNMAAMGFILQCPKVAWPLLKAGEGKQLMDAVIEFSAEFTLPELKEIMAWVNEELARLNNQGAGAGKPAAE